MRDHEKNADEALKFAQQKEKENQALKERLNKMETKMQLMEADLTKNNEFRIKTPQSPTDKEQYMLIEHIAGQVEKVQKQIESMAHNKVNISRLQKDVEKTIDNIEKLKDGQRNLKYNGK